MSSCLPRDATQGDDEEACGIGSAAAALLTSLAMGEARVKLVRWYGSSMNWLTRATLGLLVAIACRSRELNTSYYTCRRITEDVSQRR